MVAYFLGPILSYTHTAANILANEQNLVAVPTIYRVFEMISDNDIGIIPLENSTFGSVLETIDTLPLFPEIQICYEATISISHCIATIRIAKVSEITKIISHPQAIGQCSQWIAHNLNKDIERIESSSTARAASDLKKYQAESNGIVAVICSKDCANHFGLFVLEESIQNSSNNMTRFVQIQPKVKVCSRIHDGSYKTLISFTVDHDQPGSLSKAFLALNRVQLTRIDSRPSNRNPWEYIFYIEMIGHAQVAPLSDALSAVKNVTESFVLHGSFSEWI